MGGRSLVDSLVSNKNNRQTSSAMVSMQTVHGRAAVSQERSPSLHGLVSILCTLAKERRAPKGAKRPRLQPCERVHLEQKQ